MKYAICNETFLDWPFDKAFAFARECGYTGIEIAPFTINPDARQITAEKRNEVRRQAEAAGLDVVGLHWLLAKTEGLYLTTPDAAIRKATTAERLSAMRRAGFRVLGFGIENFSQNVLNEFNKGQIHRHIEPMLKATLELGITPFLDLILSSPRACLEDVAETLGEAYRWLKQGCEIGMYPYVIPFSGAALARDPALAPQTQYARQHVDGTDIEWQQAVKILPIDPAVREVILQIERNFEALLAELQPRAAHLPSRLRSLVWIMAGVPVLAEHGIVLASEQEVRAELESRLPQVRRATAARAVASA